MDTPTLSVADDRTEGRRGVPRPWERFEDRFPSVVAAYESLRGACNEAGPLDGATVALVKLAVSVGGGFERTVHMHAKKALRAGADPVALRQIVLVALPTIGLPAALDALRWVDESIGEVASVTPQETLCRPAV